jgi:hypothetical protein
VWESIFPKLDKRVFIIRFSGTSYVLQSSGSVRLLASARGQSQLQLLCHQVFWSVDFYQRRKMGPPYLFYLVTWASGSDLRGALIKYVWYRHLEKFSPIELGSGCPLGHWLYFVQSWGPSPMLFWAMDADWAPPVWMTSLGLAIEEGRLQSGMATQYTPLVAVSAWGWIYCLSKRRLSVPRVSATCWQILHIRDRIILINSHI